MPLSQRDLVGQAWSPLVLNSLIGWGLAQVALTFWPIWESVVKSPPLSCHLHLLLLSVLTAEVGPGMQR